jgi:hypothetical protein
MGNYYFTCATTGEKSKVEYTFGYQRCDDGKVRIFLHHSSVPYKAPFAWFRAKMSAIIPTYSTPYASSYGAVGTYGTGYTPSVAYGGVGGSMALFRERSMAIPMSAPMSMGSSALALPTAAAYPSMPMTSHTGGYGYGGYGGYTTLRDPLTKKHEKDSLDYQKDMHKCREAEIKAEKSRAEAMVAAAVYKEKLLNADKAMLDLAGIRNDMVDKSEKKMTEGLGDK